jgi:nicotinamidase/pyrazinamidase
MTVSTLFWDVDTQHDFMDPDGALSVPDAPDLAPNLERLTRFAVEHGVPIVASADTHTSDDSEFREFPPHCVRGTHGHAKVAATSVPGAQVADPGVLDDQLRRLTSGETHQLVVEKPLIDVFAEPLVEEVLTRLQPARVFVYGVATEYCVRAAVLGLAQRGHAATVVTDAIKPLGQEEGLAALAEMEEAGAEMATTEAVLEMLSGETV